MNLEFRVVLDAPTGLFVFVCDPLTDNRQWAAILADCGARLSADVTKVAEIMQHLRWHLAAQFVEDVARELPLRLMQLAPITTTDIEVARKDGTPHLRFQLCHYPQYFLHLTLSEERNVECVRPSVSSFFVVHPAPRGHVSLDAHIVSVHACRYRLHATDALESTCVLPSIQHTMQLRDLEGPAPPKRRRGGGAKSGVPLSEAGTAMVDSTTTVTGATPSAYDEMMHVTTLCLERIPRIEVAKQLQAHDVKHTFSLSSSSGTFLALPAVEGAPTLASLVVANMFSVDDDGVRVQVELAPGFPDELVAPGSPEEFDSEKRVITLPKLPCTRFADDFLLFWRGASILFELARALAPGGAHAAEGVPATIGFRFSSVVVDLGKGESSVVIEHGDGGLRLVLPEGSPFALVQEQLCTDFRDLNRPLLALHRGSRGLAALAQLLATHPGTCIFDAWSSCAGNLRLASSDTPTVSITFFSPDTVVVSSESLPGLFDFFKQLQTGPGGVCKTFSGSLAVPIAVFEAACAERHTGDDGVLPALLNLLTQASVPQGTAPQ